MNWKKIAATATLAAMIGPLASSAQTYEEKHDRAKAMQEAHDAHHHTKAKVVGGSAAGGAATGALVGGPVGAVVGAGIGAGGGLIANKARKHHGIHKKMHRMDS